MHAKSIKSFNKYLLSYEDSLNNTQQIGIYARDAYNCLTLARDLNSYVNDHPNSIVRIKK